jgi:hypothetical protein
MSVPVVAWKPPATLAAPVFDPQQTYEGQDEVLLKGFDFGAYASVSRVSPPLSLGDTGGAPSGSAILGSLSATPLQRPLAIGESLRAVPLLYCGAKPPGNPTVSDAALPCAALPAPTIAAPIIGQRTATVLKSVSGARIRLYDGVGVEIADGSAPLLRLRPNRVFLAGDLITAVQQSGSCTGRTGFRIGAIPEFKQ